MEQGADDKQMLDKAMAAGDDWLRRQGIITDFSVNTMIAWVYLNFEKVENVEMDVDRPNQQLFVRVYLGFWILVFMTILGRRDEFLDTIFNWMAEYLPTYEISVELKRHRGGKREKFKVDAGARSAVRDDTDEPEGNIAEAIKARQRKGENTTNPNTPSTEADKGKEQPISDSNSNGDTKPQA